MKAILWLIAVCNLNPLMNTFLKILLWVVAFVFGLLLFDERLNAYVLAGMILVIASLITNTLYKRYRSKKMGALAS